MKWSARRAFEQGRHREVVTRITTPGRNDDEMLALLGSLAFLGRLEEAMAIWKVSGSRLPLPDRVRARFALALAAMRVSRFKTARRFLRENLQEDKKGLIPDTFQGLGVYHYYIGSFTKALRFAKRALTIAIKTKNSYIHAFATDLYGHTLVQTGRRRAGIRWLSEAQGLAERSSDPRPFAVERLIYEAEAGLRPESVVEELREHLNTSEENSYSRANLALELARQLTWRGAWSEAREVLEDVAPTIYGFENRRQEITLLLRLAEISRLQGDTFGARHFLQSARRCLMRVADRAYEERILDLEHKIQNQTSAVRANPRARAPGEDPFADLMRLRERRPEVAERDMLRLGYFGLWAERFRPGEDAFQVFENGDWISVGNDGVVKGKTALTPQNRALLSRLSRSVAGKENLVCDIWGYDYDPLRHDGMIYAALNSLRRALGPRADWLTTHDNGWSFRDYREDKIAVPRNDSIGKTVDIPRTEGLNWRQIKVLDALVAQDKWTVPDYRRRFGVSTMTAWRDLDVLVAKGYILRTGKGRSTAYLKRGLT